MISLPFGVGKKGGNVGNVNKSWGDSKQAGIHIFDAMSKIKCTVFAVCWYESNIATGNGMDRKSVCGLHIEKDDIKQTQS